MASPSIFRGTLFDTKLINNIMLVKDCYQLMGNNLIDMEMNEKMLYIDSTIASQFQKNYCNNFKLKINKLYKYNMLNEIVTNIIPNCELEITGLIFYPPKSGILYIYNDKKQTNDTTPKTSIVSNESYNMIHEIKNFLMTRTYSYEQGNIKKTLYIEPTEITDVYNVYDNNDEDKIGIAHIPNLKTSTFCRENIKEKVKCVCILNKLFNKWIPLKLA
jgi:hypothetical protein